MEAVILIGIQGSGKSTFYERFLAATHLRISMDIAQTRARERRLIESCIARRVEFAIDNTNATVANRKVYIEAARAAGYEVRGYYFTTDFQECLQRNARRTGKAKIPAVGLYRTRKIFEPPTYGEGFDALFEVKAHEKDFTIAEIPRPNQA